MFTVVVLWWTALNLQAHAAIYPTFVSNPSTSQCSSSEVLQSVISNASEAVRQLIQNSPCGGLGWRQVANLDFLSQQCPSPWTLETLPARSCSLSILTGCQGVTFATPNANYSRVCGQIIGYADELPDAFSNVNSPSIPWNNVENLYLNGVSVTYGSPRKHIWSFAAGFGPPDRTTYRCPCDNTDREFAPLPPPFVGDKWFCDGEYNGALWDGKNCTTNCCTFNSPPYFTTILPAPTSDDLEVRICRDHELEVVQIGLLQLYVQ